MSAIGETWSQRDGRFERMQTIIRRAHRIADLAMYASRGEIDPDSLARKEKEIQSECNAIKDSLRA